MLQRQVYRGGPSPVVHWVGRGGRRRAAHGPIGGPDARTTGRVEDAVKGVGLLRRRLEQINSDIDLRFSQGPAQGQVQGQAPPRKATPGGHASAGITDPSVGQFAMPGPSPAASSARSRLSTDPMPPGNTVPRHRIARVERVPSPPRSPPGAPQPVPDTLNVATVGNFRFPSAARAACRFCFRTVQRGIRANLSRQTILPPKRR